MDTCTILQAAYTIMEGLGVGYSESIYQHALFNKLVKIDASTQMEKSIPVVYDGEVLGTCRADLVTSGHVIEIKATRTMPPKVCNQIRKYLVQLRHEDGVQRVGLVINFNQDTELTEVIVIDQTPTPVVHKRRKVTPCDEV